MAWADSPDTPADDEPQPMAPVVFKMPEHAPPGGEAEEEPESSDPGPPTRFELGLRSGYGVPVGAAVDGGSDINEIVAGEVPIAVDVGARFADSVFFGVNAMYGFGINSDTLNDVCTQSEEMYPGSHLDCGSSGLRVGFEVLYHPRATPLLDPYVGGGLGWEWLSFRIAASDATSSGAYKLRFNGIELLMATFGIDFTVAKKLRFGPFLAFSNDIFFNESESCEGDCTGATTSSSSIQDTTMHHWVFVGMHAGFVL